MADFAVVWKTHLMNFFFKLNNRLIIVPIVSAVLFFFSCSDHSKNRNAAFNALNESLINSNRVITKSNQLIYASLRQKSMEPFTRYKAAVWYPKAQVVQLHSNQMVNYINSLKAEVEATKIFSVRTADSLYNHLKAYRKKVMEIDREMTAVLDAIVITTRQFDSTSIENKDFSATFIHNIPVEGILSLLTKFENNVRITENMMITYCDNKVSNNAFIIEDYDSYSAIIAQNSSYVRSGDSIEITAGIGEFSKDNSIEVTINNKEVEVDELGTAKGKIAASVKPGKYSIPVTLVFSDNDGKMHTIAKNVEYTVAKE